VVAVGANTPASGIMAKNDVILGVSTGAGTPVMPFTNDRAQEHRLGDWGRRGGRWRDEPQALAGGGHE